MKKIIFILTMMICVMSSTVCYAETGTLTFTHYPVQCLMRYIDNVYDFEHESPYKAEVTYNVEYTDGDEYAITNLLIPKPGNGTEWRMDNMMLLLSDEKMQEFLEGKGFKDAEYKLYKIYVPGILVHVKSENESYFIMLLQAGDKFRHFEDKRVYSESEFKSLLGKIECNLICDGKEVDYGYGQEAYQISGKYYIPLRATLEGLGYTVEWKPEVGKDYIQKITVSKGDFAKEIFVRRFFSESSASVYVEDSNFSYSIFVKNDRFLADDGVIYMLEKNLNFEVTADLENDVIYVNTVEATGND